MRAVRIARSVGRPSALEEPAGDLPGGVHPLLDVDREREEVGALAPLRPALGRREDHRVAGADDDRAVGLLGELAGLERDLLVADRQADRHRRRLLLGFDNAHLSDSSTELVKSGGLSQPRSEGARSNFHPSGA